MMMPFGYQRVPTVEAAVRALRADPQSQLLAGGQSLLSAMKLRLAEPSMLIDLSSVDILTRIELSDDGELHIGAMCTHNTVATSALVKTHLPGLAALAAGIGDAQIRSRGTIGGSLANNDPAACYPAGLLALNGTVVTDRRTIAADEFIGPMFETALAADELIVAVRFPADVPFTYQKIEQPASRFALLGLALARTAQGHRVAVTGAADCAFRIGEFELAMDALISTQADKPNLPNEFAIERDWLDDLHGSAAYRKHLANKLMMRAAATLASSAE